MEIAKLVKKDQFDLVWHEAQYDYNNKMESDRSGLPLPIEDCEDTIMREFNEFFMRTNNQLILQFELPYCIQIIFPDPSSFISSLMVQLLTKDLALFCIDPLAIFEVQEREYEVRTFEDVV